MNVSVSEELADYYLSCKMFLRPKGVKYTGWIILLSILLFSAKASHSPCWRVRVHHASSFLCKCTAGYCDTIPRGESLPARHYATYTSSKELERFQRNTFTFADEGIYGLQLTVDASTEYQTIQGFGGSFTDAAGINIKSLPPQAQTNLLKSYFSTDGLEYSMGRVPIHSCDFSTHIYSYDDTPEDLDLSDFALAPEDLSYKIPVIQEAQRMSPHTIKLVASPWSAPAWMKDNNNMIHGGSLKGSPGGPYYKAWAKYFVRFLQEYENQGVSIWGLTIQNEPSAASIPFYPYPWQSMAMPAQTARDFVKTDLGPALRDNGYGWVKLLSNDDNLPSVLADSQVIYADSQAAQYLSGIAVHWYMTWNEGAYEILDQTHEALPDKFLLATEACVGYKPSEQPVKLGDWERGERYSMDILQDLNHWVTGWVDWNLALDIHGGPNWANNEVDSAIIVHSSRQTFYKQPIFYHMGHFSKFVPPGSVRIDLKASIDTVLHSVAFRTPDNSTAVILLNNFSNEAHISLHDPQHGYINTVMPPRSIRTIVW